MRVTRVTSMVGVIRMHYPHLPPQSVLLVLHLHRQRTFLATYTHEAQTRQIVLAPMCAEVQQYILLAHSVQMCYLIN